MADQSSFTFKTSDGIEIFVSKRTTGKEEKPQAIVQLAHGMAEHIKRYDNFANKLVSENIVVFGNDHRGHGMTAKLNNSMGYFADEQGFEKVVQDMLQLTNIIEAEYPEVPISYYLDTAWARFCRGDIFNFMGKNLLV